MENTDVLRDKAERYRRMASRVDDPRATAALLELAERYEAIAMEQEGSAPSANKD